jgi:hypothetical protein
MKRILVLAVLAMFAVSAAALAGDEAKKEEAKPVTLTGEVLDLYCYFDHKASGPDHAKCATSCIKKGLPVGFLAADGTMYIVIGKEHEPINATVAEFAGKKSTITGTVKEQGGVKAIELVSIADAK